MGVNSWESKGRYGQMLLSGQLDVEARMNAETQIIDGLADLYRHHIALAGMPTAPAAKDALASRVRSMLYAATGIEWNVAPEVNK